MKPLDTLEVRHVLREENIRADILSKLASIKHGGNNQSLIQETLKFPSITDSLPILVVKEISNWMTSIIHYLRNAT